MNFEKYLPDDLIRSRYKALSIWSLVRMPLLSQLARKLPREADVATGMKKRHWSEKIGLVWEMGFFAFVYEIIKCHSVQVIIRVNSFSILGETGNRILFKNKNLQDIYDHISMSGVCYLIIVNDLGGYQLQQKLGNAIVFPVLLPSLLGRLCYGLNRSALDRIVNVYTDNLPLDSSWLRKVILRNFAAIFIWNTIYKYLKPKVIYYESPHNAFESEIVAAKGMCIKTVEIYHGIVTPNESSYFQKHLDFGGLMHSVCDEYLSPSNRQTKLLMEHNAKFKKITTIAYKSSIKLSIREKLRIVAHNKSPLIGKKKILFVTSLCDHAIRLVHNYLKKNHKYILKSYNKISIRLHPLDTEERWSSVKRKFPYIEFSQLALIEDVINSNSVILVNTTVALELKSLNINYINISDDDVI